MFIVCCQKDANNIKQKKGEIVCTFFFLLCFDGFR